MPSAITYVVESIPHRGVTGCAIIMAAMAAGVLLANGCNALLISWLPPEMVAYAWRIAFVLGGVLGLVNYPLRKNTLHGYAQSGVVTARIPFVALLRRFPGRVISGMAVASVVAIYSSLFYVYIPSYLTRILDYDPKEVATTLTICFFVGPLATLLFGVVGDRVSALKLHRFGSVVIVFGAVSAFMALVGHNRSAKAMLGLLPSCPFGGDAALSPLKGLPIIADPAFHEIGQSWAGKV
ncbi:MFS transporter [Bradyrhizobium liaoningense]